MASSAPHGRLGLPDPLEDRRYAWTALGLMGILALVQLYPGWFDWTHTMPGNWRHPDTVSNLWLYRWIPEQLLAGQSIIHNSRYYAPVGDAPWLAGNGSDAIPFTALYALLPWPLSINLWVALAFTLNGLAGTALARQVGASRGASLIAGATLAMSPYVAWEVSCARYAQMPLYWFGFFLAAWIALLRDAPSGFRPDKRTLLLGLLAGLLFGGTAFTYFYYGLWAVWAGVLLFAFRRRWSALVSFVPAALLTTLPPLVLFARHWADIPGVEEAFPNPASSSFKLAPGFALYGAGVTVGDVILPLTGWVLALVRVLSLARSSGQRGAGALLAAVRAMEWWERACWLGVFFFAALGLGPSIGFGGVDVPGPFVLVYGLLAPLRRFWWPYRHIAALTLLLVPLVGPGADLLIERIRGRAFPEQRRLVPVLTAAAVVALLPLDVGLRGGRVFASTSWYDPPKAYQQLADLPGTVLLELPLAPELSQGQQTLSYQWEHDKDLINGHALWVSRVRPPEWDAFVRDNSLLHALQLLEQGKEVPPVAPADVASLLELGLRLIVVNREHYAPALESIMPLYVQYLGALFGDPVIEEGRDFYVWDVAQYTGATGLEGLRVFDLPEAFVGRGDQLADGEGTMLGPSMAWQLIADLAPPGVPPRKPTAGGAGSPAASSPDSPAAKVEPAE